ncbi:MAG: Asp-tRNA(Asn)/Glu-tRNA(Gln) amidotransferase subunit GatB, partial [Parcubacteria group bacterium]|nr:Asp-tRNA(Asn)/Glu-tRNA(Gln) amidotransferase subunit GatB [Parcubacteria group bacterium]
YEIKRQTELLEKDQKIIHETRGWDENKKQTFSQRWKEEAEDYRYFPEPDLPPLYIGAKPKEGGVIFDLEAIRKGLLELPSEKRERFVREYGLSPEETELLINEPEYAGFFEKAVVEISDEGKARGGIKYLYNYLVSDIKGVLLEEGKRLSEVKIQPSHLAKIGSLLKQDKISSRVAKDLLSRVIESGEDPKVLIQEGGLLQISDEGEIEKIVKRVLENEPRAVEDYKKGKANAMQFLAGKVMAETRGRANPALVQEVLKKLLGSS